MVLRRIYRIVFHASRDGRAAEIAAWSNAAASLLLAGGAVFLRRSWPLAAVLAVAAFVLLRAALANRHTVWLAASFGTLAVGGLGGGLAWLFAHVIDASAAPPIAAVVGAVASATLPAAAYGRLAQRRAANVPDSLVAPASSNR